MSHVRDLSVFDWVLLLVFVFGLGFVAYQSKAPETALGPTVEWPEAPPIVEKADIVVEEPVAEPVVVEEEAEEVVEEESWD